MTGVALVGLFPWKGAALYLGVSVTTLRRLVKAGEIPPPIDVTEGRKAFPYEDIEEFRQKVIARSRGSAPTT